MRRMGCLLQVIILMQLLAGCWSRVEVNDLSIVTAAAIDKLDDGKIRVALQIAIPMMLGPIGGAVGGGVGEKKSTVVVSEKGETVLDAYRRIQEKLPRKLFFSHNRIIVIGEKLARDGISPVLDFFSRYRESRLRSFILFSKGEAVEILKISPKWERISAEEIREEEKSRIGLQIYLNEFLDMLLTDGMEPVAAQVQAKPSEIMAGDSAEKQASLSKKEMNVAIAGAAVFHKDKLAGWLNDAETRGMLWLRNELQTGVVTVTVPKEHGGGKISVKILNGETKLNPLLKDNKVIMEVEARAEDDLYENSSNMDLSKPESVRLIQQWLEEDINKRIQLTLDQVQRELKSDVIGFGSAVNRKYPKEWNAMLKNRWDEEFPQVEVNITSHVKVIRSGLTNKSMTGESRGDAE